MFNVKAVLFFTIALASAPAFAELPPPLGDVIEEVCAVLTQGGQSPGETADCASAVADKLYRCEANDERFGPQSHQCWQFDVASPQSSTKFDLAGLYACSCEPTGTVENPDFNASGTDFVCLAHSESGAPPTGVHGVVSEQGNRVRITSVIEDGTTTLVECVPDPACIACGDGTCNGDETCETCNPDCGTCPEECTDDVDGDGDLDCPGDGDNDLECPDEDGDGMESCETPTPPAPQTCNQDEDCPTGEECGPHGTCCVPGDCGSVSSPGTGGGGAA